MRASTCFTGLSVVYVFDQGAQINSTGSHGYAPERFHCTVTSIILGETAPHEGGYIFQFIPVTVSSGKAYIQVDEARI